MIDGLPEWLTTQLDIDEAKARACSGNGEWTARDIAVFGADLSPGVREHMAAHDPARVLREIDAKRQIIDLHRSGQHHQCRTGEHDDGYAKWVGICTTLRLLALPYADRPGYRNEWRP